MNTHGNTRTFMHTPLHNHRTLLTCYDMSSHTSHNLSTVSVMRMYYACWYIMRMLWVLTACDWYIYKQNTIQIMPQYENTWKQMKLRSCLHAHNSHTHHMHRMYVTYISSYHHCMRTRVRWLRWSCAEFASRMTDARTPIYNIWQNMITQEHTWKHMTTSACIHAQPSHTHRHNMNPSRTHRTPHQCICHICINKCVRYAICMFGIWYI